MAESIQITLPDGSTKAAPSGIRVGDFVKESIGPGLAKAAVLARFNGNEVDLSRPLTENGKLEVLTAKAPEALDTIRHDAAHVVASAVQQLFPGTQVTIGPTIEDGFYYDFFRDQPFTPEELQAIEEEANKEIAQEPPLRPRGGERRRRHRALPVQGREVQGRDHRGHRRQGRQDPHALPPRRLGGLLPRPARPVDRKDRGDQAAQHQRRLLARRSSQPDAPAHLRHRLLRQEGARRLAEAAGGGQEARPPEARQRARSLRVLPRGAGRGVLEPEGHRALPGARGPDAPLDARRTATTRSRRRCSTTRRSGRTAATGASTGRTCSWCSTTRPASTTSA